VIVEEFQPNTVGYNGGLANGDVGKRSRMHHAGIVFGGTHHGWIDGVAHKSGHGVADFQITSRDGFAGLVEGHRDVVEPFFQVGQIADNRQDGHTLGAHGDAESGLHRKAVHAAADTDNDVAQGLGTKVDDPAHLHTGGIDIQTRHAGQPIQLLVIVVALMLHASGQGHHSQVVGIHDVVDVAGQTQ